MLGTGLIGDFYTMTLHGGRGPRPGRGRVLPHRRAGEAFADGGTSRTSTTTSTRRSTIPTPTWWWSASPTTSTRRPIALAADAGKAVLCTKPLARTADEAKRILDMVEGRACSPATSRTSVHPEDAQGDRRRRAGAIGDVTWVRCRETHPGPHSAWFWYDDLAGGGAIVDLGCHCIEIIRSFVGKGNRPVEVMCWSDTFVHPIEAEDNAIALIRFESGAIGQFEVSWTFRGGMDLRDEVAGTEGTIWTQPLPAHRVRDVLQRRGRATSPRRRRPTGLAVPGR